MSFRLGIVNKKRREWRKIRGYVAAELASIHLLKPISNSTMTAVQKCGEKQATSNFREHIFMNVSHYDLDSLQNSFENCANLDCFFCHEGTCDFKQQLSVHHIDSSSDPVLNRSIGSSSAVPEYDSAVGLKDFLHKWAVQYNLSRTAMSDLLKGLHSNCCSNCSSSLPRDGRSVVGTKRNVSTQIQNKAGGQYVHIGVVKGIQRHISGTTDGLAKLIAIVNIDGLPIFKSSALQFWPILMRIINGNYDKPFVVGIYAGTCKPQNVHEFLSEFVADMASVMSSGITVNHNHFDVALQCIICDAPALAMIKCIKGHCGFSGCPRCVQDGTRASNCTVFLETNSALRTDALFRENVYNEDHQLGISPLIDLQIDLVKDLPYDYMHLVCLGVTKRLINAWLSGPLATRLPNRLVQEVSHNLESLRGSMP
jgi:hypothetical protein